jgi:hypothetical protein
VIKKFIQNQFETVFGKNSEEILFIYVGKQLDFEKTFAEEFVEDLS